MSRLFQATAFSVLCLTTRVAGLKYLPEHARGGLVAKLAPELIPPTPSLTSVHWVAQMPLDHFGDDKRTFGVNYFIDDSCWDPLDGPIFVEMGGEGPCGGASCGKLHRTHKALAVSVEHRFYGESIPFNNRSLPIIKYLSVEQNLADTAAIIELIQANLTKRRVVMNFGGSYSGATAAWFRLKYPNTTYAASSSSGVVNAILNFTQFDAHVEAAIDRPKPGCAARLKEVTAAFERTFVSDKDTAKTIMGATNLIGTKNGDNDFWYMIADSAAMADQYGRKSMLCSALSKPYTASAKPSDTEIMKNFYTFTTNLWGKSFPSMCFYDSECLLNTTNTDMSRSWRWQKCTELAYLQPGYKGSLRHEALSLENLLDQCRYVFGDDVIQPDCNTKRTNEFFGGATPTEASRIVFLDYSDDPWSDASVQHALGPELPYCYTECDGCGHCGAGVPPTETRCSDMEASYIAKWLAQAQQEMSN